MSNECDNVIVAELLKDRYSVTEVVSDDRDVVRVALGLEIESSELRDGDAVADLRE